TITVTNSGPSNATGVQVTDQLPAGMTFIFATPSACTYSSGTGVWNIGGLASGGSQTLTITATVTTTGSLTNTATKTAETETDPNAGNNSASASITGQAPDLTIAKSHIDPFVRGSNGSYSLTVSNVGPAPSGGLVTVSDTLPAGLTPLSASGSGWTCGIVAQVVTCTRSDALTAAASYPLIVITVAVQQSAPGSLTSGASSSLTLFAIVTGTGTITNAATKSAENEIDPNLGNNAASAAIVGQAAPGLPGPPNGGMAPAPDQPDPLRGSLMIEAGLAGFFGLLFLRRRSQRVAVAAALMGFATISTILAPAGAPLSSAPQASLVAARPSDIELFGKPISTVKPQLGSLGTSVQPATGPIVPYRIRIPALGIDTVVESVGVTARGLMDVPGNIWDAGWLQSGAKPGALGQAIIDG